MRYLFFITGFLIMSSSILAQDQLAARQLETTWVEARVIGTLNTDKKLAILQLQQVDPKNTFQLVPLNEILVEFIYPENTDSTAISFAELEGGELIKAEVNGSERERSGQRRYLVFRFQLEQAKK